MRSDDSLVFDIKSFGVLSSDLPFKLQRIPATNGRIGYYAVRVKIESVGFRFELLSFFVEGGKHDLACNHLPLPTT